MKVRVHLSALTRMYYTVVVEAPDSLTGFQLDDVVDMVYDQVDGGEFLEDEHFWEKGEANYWEKTEEDLSPGMRVSVEEDEILLEEIV